MNLTVKQIKWWIDQWKNLMQNNFMQKWLDDNVFYYISNIMKVSK